MQEYRYRESKCARAFAAWRREEDTNRQDCSEKKREIARAENRKDKK